MNIHPTAIIDAQASIHPDAIVKALAVISGPVVIGAGTIVESFAHLTGHTKIGENCRIHSNAVVGDVPQDRSFSGGISYCEIGARTTIREGATIHRGTAAGTTTIVGNDCLVMSNAHVAHNCVIGDGAVLVNGSLLGGYVSIGNRAIVSGNAAVHQHVRVGELAMVGILARITRDVPPYVITDREGDCVSLNTVGLHRAGFDAISCKHLKDAYRILFRSGLQPAEALALLQQLSGSPPVALMLDFMRQSNSGRAIAGAKRKHKPRLAA